MYIKLSSTLRDVLDDRLRDKSAIYKDVPASHNKNNVNAKAIYLTEEKKYAPRVDFCSKTTLGIELQEFRDIRVPMKDPTEFWRYSGLTRLGICAKIVFSAPVSSAAVERLFSQAGNLLRI